MAHPTLQIITNFWDITLELYPEYAPKAVENFLGLAEQGYYDGVIFHRVIQDFMIQSWDPTGTGRGGKSLWHRPFADEFTDALTHTRGVISMANAGRNTNGSQFFIVTAEDASFLDGKHTIFGRVTDGLDTVLEIDRVPTDGSDRPKIAVRIETIEKKS